jgi:2-polyprenyl-3-methyl-5-hydroxy-6-metoxy-1,4-benzoquinol methylase
VGQNRFENVPIEEVKTYWNSRPCNIRHSPSKVGTRTYFDEIEARKYIVEPHIPRFAEFEKWKDKRVLEIGCGIGTDTMNFARAGAQVTAVDISDRSLELAKQRTEIEGLTTNIEFYQVNAEELVSVVPVAPFDLVYSFGVIHHTPHPEQVIEQIKHFVKPGGTLKLMVYHRYSWKVLGILLIYGKGAFWKLDELVARHSEAQTGCPITYTYSKQAIRELLMLNGFEITDISVDHIFPYMIEDYVHYRYNKVCYFRYLPKSAFQWLEHHFGWHLCVTARVTQPLI